MVQRKHKTSGPTAIRNESTSNLVPGNTSSFAPALDTLAHTIPYRFEQMPLYAKPAVVQPKLNVSEPGDAHERQADAMAEKVVQPTEQATINPVYAGNTYGTAINPELADRITSSKGSGQPIDRYASERISGRFGVDFSQVKIHAGSEAVKMNNELNARAFTTGNDIFFNKGEYNPHSQEGEKLLTHELTHVVQQTGSESSGMSGHQPSTLQKKEKDDTIEVDLVTVSDEENEKLKKQGIDLPQVSKDTWGSINHQPVQPLSSLNDFVSGAAKLAPCPAIPPVTLVKPAYPSDLSDQVTLPVFSTERFADNSTIESFAKALALCHAERVVQEEVTKRYTAAKDQAKKGAIAQAKIDKEQAISDAVSGVDSKDIKAVQAARKTASKQAEEAAKQKIAGAQDAVKKPDIEAVKQELAKKFEEELLADFTETMQAAINRFKAGWLAHMQAIIKQQKAKITKEKTPVAKKVKKGEEPPPVKPAEEIANEIEAAMVPVRQAQYDWAYSQFDRIIKGWMVGRREEIDFKTVAQNVKGLKDFNPVETVEEADRVQIPDALKSDKTMPGVAPAVADFLLELQKLEPGFTAGNYAGHGGGKWAGAGLSVDLFLVGKNAGLDDRGFWQHDTAVRFLLNLDAAAKTIGARWRVLYNDFGVAEEVNRATGFQNVGFMGNNPRGTLNWHGPGPMVLHFHLDLEVPAQEKSAP